MTTPDAQSRSANVILIPTSREKNLGWGLLEPWCPVPIHPDPSSFGGGTQGDTAGTRNRSN